MNLSATFEDEALAVHLMLEDVKYADKAALKDQEAAFELYCQDLNELASNHATCVLQQKIAAAALDNDAAITEALRLEQQDIDDRQIAARLSGYHVTISQQACEQAGLRDVHDESTLTHLASGLSDDDDNDSDDDDFTVVESEVGYSQSMVSFASSSATRVEQYFQHLRTEESKQPVECMVCTESFHPTQATSLDCNHTWCRHCVSKRFESATDNEGSWPPRCCSQSISATGQVYALLSPSLRARFAAKSIEWGTTDRTYCYEQTCSEFILPNTIRGRWAHCPRCNQDTCSDCKEAYHSERPCPAPESENLLRELAQEQGWPECPGCKRYVEITHGCNHMT